MLRTTERESLPNGGVDASARRRTKWFNLRGAVRRNWRGSRRAIVVVGLQEREGVTGLWDE